MKPAAGRMVRLEDAEPGATPVFMMSYKLWQQQFNTDPKIVGTNFVLNGVSRTWSASCHRASAGRGLKCGCRSRWIGDRLPPILSSAKVMSWCVGRLKPGVSLRAAEADLDVGRSSTVEDLPE